MKCLLQLTRGPVERRTCRFCDLVAIEDEKHFLLTCDLYNDIRTYVFGDILRQNEFMLLNTELKMCHLLNNYPRKSAKFIVKAYIRRRTVMYS